MARYNPNLSPIATRVDASAPPISPSAFSTKACSFFSSMAIGRDLRSTRALPVAIGASTGRTAARARARAAIVATCPPYQRAGRRRHSRTAATSSSTPTPTSLPRSDRAGAGAVVIGRHSPSRPGRLQISFGPVHGSLRHTPSTQNINSHCDGVVQGSPIWPAGVFVGVCVTVAVTVAVLVAVLVAVAVRVAVLVRVAVWVAVLV